MEACCLLLAVAMPAGGSRIPAADALPRDPREPGFEWVDLFESLTFTNPVAVVSPPGETNRIFVVERTGTIQVVHDLAHPKAELFLDVRTNLSSRFIETGLLGLAFHPEYATNGHFFVFRTMFRERPEGGSALFDVLSRFTAPADGLGPVDPATEVILIAQEDASAEHNAGDIQFGPDGYLYLSVGDSSPPPHSHDGTLQRLDGGFFGGILRIDVDGRPGNPPPNPHPGVTPGRYWIPADNPFIGLTNHHGRTLDPARVRTEFYAIGMRNPWRMSFDELTGELYVGDVGNGAYEEINRIVAGGNYGWPYREGPANGIYHFITPDGLAPEPPWIAYPHGSGIHQGDAVIGGVFYRGTLLPGLTDHYIFADCRSGHTWAVDPREPEPALRWLCTETGISAFGRDPRDGEILAANYALGRIRKLRRVEPGERLPATLADTRVFTNLETLEPRPWLHPYTINAPFWSDGALKWRWFALPEESPAIDVTSDGRFVFPPGAVWVKHFELELVPGEPASRRRLETRLLVKTETGGYGMTYRWGDSLTNAWLVPSEGMDEAFVVTENGVTRTQVWHYPGRAECMRCHNDPDALALGFNPLQLNCPAPGTTPPVSQLDRLRELDFLPDDHPDAESLPALVNPADSSRPLALRARSYLASNCAGCHRPGHIVDAPVDWDGRFHIPLGQTRLLNGSFVLPGSPQDSRILTVLRRDWIERMPPLASNEPDQGAIELMRRWISGIPHGPWTASDTGGPDLPGGSTMEGGTTTLSSRAGSLDGQATGAHLLQRLLTGDGFLEAELSRFENPGPGSRAGLIFGRSLPEAAATVLYDADGTIRYGGSLLDAANGSVELPSPPPSESDPLRVRIARSASQITLSAGGAPDQTFVASGHTGPLSIGFLLNSGTAFRDAHAWFTGVKFLQARWTSPHLQAPIRAPATVTFSMEIEASGVLVRKVEYVAGEQVIGSSTTAPFAVTWHNPPAGRHAVLARIHLSDDSVFLPSPIGVDVEPAVPLVRFAGEDRESGGDWTGRYGGSGYQFWQFGTMLPQGVAIESLNGTHYHWDGPTEIPSAPWIPGFGERHAMAQWHDDRLELRIDNRDGLVRRFAFYFLDWDTVNERRQSVELYHPESGELLDRQVVSSFTSGAYLVWEIRGSVIVRILPEGPPNAVVSAVLLDEAPHGSAGVHLTSPEDGSRVTAPAAFHLAAMPADASETPALVEFLSNGQRIAALDAPPFEHTWAFAPVGAHQLTARAWDRFGRSSDSAPVSVHVDPAETSAEFLGFEPVARGLWQGRFGASAHAIPAGSESWPPSIRFFEPGYRIHVWNSNTTDPRAPHRLSASTRMAACWVDGSRLEFDLDFLDGAAHLLTLYLLDWESDQRRQVIEIIDRTTAAVLDSRPMERFYQGVHMVYRVRGSIRVRVVAERVNAAISGIFVDPLATPPGAPLVAIQEFGLSGEGVLLRWTAPPGSLFRIHGTPDLAEPWRPFPVVASSVSGEFEGVVPLADDPGFDRNGFFRLELLSQPPPAAAMDWPR